MVRITMLLLTALASMNATAQTKEIFEYDMTKQQPVYSEEAGYGYDVIDAPDGKTLKPFYFSQKVDDGNYKVTVVLGSKKQAGNTVVRAESRRLLLEDTATKKGELKTVEFIVNKRSPKINKKESVKIKDREKTYLDWDDRLTLEFNGSAPVISSIKIEPAPADITTIFLCGNSTVVDQNNEPYASWGQMIPRWFDTTVSISNHGESGLTAKSFLAGKRLDKILAMMKKGDWVFVEFGHNDAKEKGAGYGPWYHYSMNLKIFVDKVRDKGGNIVFCTPTMRRMYEKDNKTIRNSHGEFPAAMKAVAERENVPIIDLSSMTKDFFEALGKEDSKKALCYYAMGSFPNQQKELADPTHFNPYGAYEVAKMVIMGMKQHNLPMLKGLKADFRDFDPKQPDDADKFVWYRSAKSDVTKPDGD